MARPIKMNLPKPPTRVETEPRPAPEAQDEVKPNIQMAAMKIEDQDAITPDQRRAYEKMMGQWDVRAPRTTVVIQEQDDTESRGHSAAAPASGQKVREATAGAGAGAIASTKHKVLVPAGRGVYAHTILAVTTDSGGPIILEADTGPLWETG